MLNSCLSWVQMYPKIGSLNYFAMFLSLLIITYLMITVVTNWVSDNLEKKHSIIRMNRKETSFFLEPRDCLWVFPIGSVIIKLVGSEPFSVRFLPEGRRSWQEKLPSQKEGNSYTIELITNTDTQLHVDKIVSLTIKSTDDNTIFSSILTENRPEEIKKMKVITSLVLSCITIGIFF